MLIYSYILSSEDFFLYDIQNSKGAKMPRGSKEAVLNYQVPVPPLSIQAEIVRILDNFTKVTAELTEQLSAELIARKKQYEYYRDKLLTFDVHGGGQVMLYGGHLRIWANGLVAKLHQCRNMIIGLLEKFLGSHPKI